MSKILLLEPDRQLAGNLKDYLASANHKVYVHSDPQAAIAEADKHKLDLIITELQLAGRSGIEFLYEFRSYPDWQVIPVIMTGNVDERGMSVYSEVFNELNVRNYFYKPALKFNELAATVENCLKIKA